MICDKCKCTVFKPEAGYHLCYRCGQHQFDEVIPVRPMIKREYANLAQLVKTNNIKEGIKKHLHDITILRSEGVIWPVIKERFGIPGDTGTIAKYYRSGWL